MNPENNSSKKIKLDLNLNLSLGIPQEEEEEDGLQEVVVEEHGSFMQLLGSVSDPPPPPPPHHINYDWPQSLFEPPPPPPYHMTQAYYHCIPSSSSSGHGVFQPFQAIEGGNGAFETPRKVGRPPGVHQGRHKSKRAVAAVAVVVPVDEEIVPPYPWATTRKAIIHNLTHLFSQNIYVISGQVKCRSCEKTQTLEYNLQEKFEELYQYIKAEKEELRQRAPEIWKNPKLTPCGSCNNGMKPVISDKKEEINWLFLLLGQMLGCCTLEQLRYFCDKTKQHRTGAKDRVLYITYLGLCRQLDPRDTFNL